MATYRKLILLIKERPSMYLGCNSISCLKAFLDGWSFREPDGISDNKFLDDFQLWIEKRFVHGGTQSFAKIILFYSQDECSALTSFFKLFDEFVLQYDQR
jgi:hypothetical protein